jgi:succinate dehydrogenase / fumarate reductase, cytochrome b subunit
MESNAPASTGAAPAAEAASPAAYDHPLLQTQHAPKPGCACGVLRPPRKFHAAVGLWLAAFLGVHFLIGLTGINPRNYEGAVGLLHRSLAYLPGAVFLLVFLPMLLQAASGLFLLAKEGLRYDVKSCNRGGKLRFFLQRWSGLAMVAFLLAHVASMRGRGLAQPGYAQLGHWSALASSGAPDGAAYAYTASGFHPFSSPALDAITIVLLLIGVLGTVYHVANGACSGGILWKLAESDGGKARLTYMSAIAGLALAVMGGIAWYAFSLAPTAHVALASAGH